MTRLFRLANLGVLLMLGSTAFAQNAQIIGAVKDETGGALPGATVIARNKESGLTRTAITDGTGSYRLGALPPGLYSVSTTLAGFTSGAREILLVIDQTAAIPFVMRPASMTENVDVVAEAPLVDASVATVSTSVSNAQIQSLPVASRRWIDLAMLTPGTSQDNIRGFFYRGNVNVGGGAREYSNAFVVDGVNNTWAQMGEPRQNFAMEAIREFKVSTSNYKAEYGLATGGLVSVVSKTGTNEFHGGVFTFFRDDALTEKATFEVTKPPYQRYQYGGSIGGPIVKDKTHFFFTYEGTRESQFLTVNSLGVWPQYDGTYESEQKRWTYLGRIDHKINAEQTAFFRWAAEDEYRPIITTGGRTHPTASFDFAVPRSSAVAGHTWVKSQNSINDFRIQYAFAKYKVAPPYSNGDWEPGDFGPDRLSLCTPIFTYPSLTLGGCGNSQMGPEKRFQIRDDFSHIRGNHVLKAGFDGSIVNFQFDNMGSPLGSWTFPRDVPYNAADPTTYPTQYTNSLPTYGETPIKVLGLYIQDDWTPTAGLTFNLGLRFDRQFGSYNEDIEDLLSRVEDKLGRDGAYPLPIPFHEGSDARGDKNNWGPRIGFAWDPGRDGKTSIRGGYGLFYDNVRTLLNGAEITWPQSKTIVISRPTFPDPFGGRSRNEFVSSAPPNITVNANDFESPYAHQFNLGVSRTLTTDIAVTLDATMANRKADRETVDLNLPGQTSRVRPYPQFARVTNAQSTFDNTFKALLVKIEKRMSHNYQVLVSYTYSEAKDDGFTSAAAGAYGFTKVERYGTADRRHRLVFSGIVRLPAGFQFSAIGDFRSSLPFSPTTSLDLNADGYTGDLPAGVAVGSGCRELDLAAVNAFRATRKLAAVNSVACPTYKNIDLRLSKTFTLNSGGTAHRFELVAQLFNVLNQTNYNVPVNNLGSAPFGQVNSLLPNINAPSRQIELAIRYSF